MCYRCFCILLVRRRTVSCCDNSCSRIASPTGKRAVKRANAAKTAVVFILPCYDITTRFLLIVVVVPSLPLPSPPPLPCLCSSAHVCTLFSNMRATDRRRPHGYFRDDRHWPLPRWVSPPTQLAGVGRYRVCDGCRAGRLRRQQWVR